MRKYTDFWMGLRGMLKLYKKMLKNVCTAHDLAVTEADILGFLKNNPDKDTAADIAELKMLSKGAVSKSVDSLIGKGLLHRCPDKQDRRKIHLKITPEADPVISDIIKVQEEFRNAMFDGFTEEEYRTYEDYRIRLFENAKKTEEAGIDAGESIV